MPECCDFAGLPSRKTAGGTVSPNATRNFFAKSGATPGFTGVLPQRTGAT